MALIEATSGECARCGTTLAPEAELESIDSKCPRCQRGLFRLSGDDDVQLDECRACGGLFVKHDQLAALVARHRPRLGTPVVGVRSPTSASIDPSVVYLPCPGCGSLMNRTIFGRRSGVLVDVCKMHGTWFDARELEDALAFVDSGGLELAEKQALELANARKRAAAIELRAIAMNAAFKLPADRWHRAESVSQQADALADIVSVLFAL